MDNFEAEESSFREVTLEDLKSIAEAMRLHAVEYVVFGGIALNVHRVPRATQDIDIFIRNSKENIDNFLKAFRTLPMFLNITDADLVSLVEDHAFDCGVIKFGGDIGLDIATSMGERTIDSLSIEMITLDGVEIPVITLEQLYEMKSDSLRDKDMEDVLRLRQLRGDDLF